MRLYLIILTFAIWDYWWNYQWEQFWPTDQMLSSQTSCPNNQTYRSSQSFCSIGIAGIIVLSTGTSVLAATNTTGNKTMSDVGSAKELEQLTSNNS